MFSNQRLEIGWKNIKVYSMALKQTKTIQIKKTKKIIHKTDLAKELNVSVAIVNEYILGDKIIPNNLKIIPDKNGMVVVESEERYEAPKYEGVFYNELRNGDRSFFIIYKEVGKKGPPITLKIGKESDGITETFCVNKRKEILEISRLGEKQTKIKNKRVISEITTLNFVAEKYHKNRKKYMTEANLKKSESLYKRRIQPTLGDKDILEITKADIINIMDTLITILSNKSINIVVEKISTLFNFAIKENLFQGKNQAKYIERLSEENQRTRYLSKDEIKLLLEAVKNNQILYIFTFLALTTGGRHNAICSLKVKDINFEQKTINMYDAKRKIYYDTYLKNDKDFIELLKGQIKGMSSISNIYGEKTVKAHSRYIQRELSKIFKSLFNEEIIKKEKEYEKEKNIGKNELAEMRRDKVVIHTLRHTFASQLVINGIPIYTVQKLLNHKDSKMTERYAKLGKNAGRDSIEDIL